MLACTCVQLMPQKKCSWSNTIVFKQFCFLPPQHLSTDFKVTRRWRDIFRPLDLSPNSRQIRLLKLLPVKSLDDDIRCTIFHTSLDDSSGSEALSYAWSSEDNPLSICVRYHLQHIARVSQQHEAEDRNTSLDHGLHLGVTRNL